MLLRQVIGSNLRAHREEQRRSLRDVAGAARVSLGYLSEVERGRKEASSELLASICRALDLTLADLLGDAITDLRGAELLAPRPAAGAQAGRPVESEPDAASEAPAPAAPAAPVSPERTPVPASASLAGHGADALDAPEAVDDAPVLPEDLGLSEIDPGGLAPTGLSHGLRRGLTDVEVILGDRRPAYAA